ncbi:MAG: hypothetical protein RMK45_09745 [Armatimonadota bacterium]|nr:hypothetical protein [Armatimonadota bacterium]
MRRVFGIGAIALLLSISLAQEYTLKLSVKEGDTFKYKATMELDFGGQQVLVNFTTTNKVLKVEQDGTIQMESTTSETMVKFGDQEMSQPGPPPIKVSFKPNGAIAKVEGEANSAFMFQSGWAVFPDKPIKVGDKWNSTLKVGEFEIKYEYELASVEKVGDAEALRIKFTASSASTSLNSNGFMLIDAKNGMMLRMETQFKSMQVSESFPPFDGTFKMELMKGNGSPTPQGATTTPTP